MNAKESFSVPETSQPSPRQAMPANDTVDAIPADPSEGETRTKIDNILHKYGYPTQKEAEKLTKTAQSGFTRIELERLLGQNTLNTHREA